MSAAVQTHTYCQHCRCRPATRARRLCWACFHRPGVRELYPSTHPCARRGSGHPADRRPLPEPTDAPPGSPEKQAVLVRRAESGQQLFHPADARVAQDGDAGWRAVLVPRGPGSKQRVAVVDGVDEEDED